MDNIKDLESLLQSYQNPSEEEAMEGAIEGQNPPLADDVNAIVQSPNAPTGADPKPAQKMVNEEVTGRAYPTQKEAYQDLIQQKSLLDESPQSRSLAGREDMLKSYKDMKPKKEDNGALKAAAWTDALSTLSNIVNAKQGGAGIMLPTQAVESLKKQRTEEKKVEAAKEKADFDRKIAERKIEVYEEVSKGNLEATKAKQKIREEERELKKKEKEEKKARQEKLDTLKQEGEERRQAKEDRKQRLDELNAARGLLKDDPRYKEILQQSKAFDEVGKLMEQVESGNQAATAAAGTKLARAMGEVGVLTDQDVVRYIRGQSWGRQFQDWLTKGMKGTLSKEMIKDIKDNLGIFKNALQGNADNIYSNAGGRLKAAFPDLNDQQVDALLGKPKLFTDSAVQNNTVLLEAPNGQRKRVAADKVEKYLSKGAKVIKE